MLSHKLKTLMEPEDDDPGIWYWYTLQITKNEWPNAEPHIIKSIEWAYWYSKAIIKRRWPQAEKAIKQNPHYALLYAANVIKGEWPEAEETIKASEEHASIYYMLIDEDSAFVVYDTVHPRDHRGHYKGWTWVN